MIVCSPSVRQQIGTWPAEHIEALLRHIRETSASHAERVVKVSAIFLGTPYRLDPLGEGEQSGKDTDPLMNLQEVDCVTFIEEVMALALSNSVAESQQRLIDIRYSTGKPDYLTRNHFMEAQWIPNNKRKGYIRDVTSRIGGEATLIAHKALNASIWKQRKRPEEGPALEPEQVPAGVFSLPVIPIEYTPEIIDQIPAGTILSLVRADYHSIPYRISHQGIVVVKRGKRYLRHASRTYAGKVADEPLEGFLARAGAYTRWPVFGINLLAILDKRD